MTPNEALLERRFRQFVILAMCLTVVVELLGWFYVPSNELEAQLKLTDGYAATLNGGLVLWALLLAIRLLLLFGLIAFHPTARVLFLAFVAVSVLLTIFFGYRISTPVEGPFLVLEQIMDGVILALPYYSPVSRSFTTQAT